MENLEKDKKLNYQTLFPEIVAKKLRIASGLFKMAYQVKVHQMRLKYPNLSQKEINHMAYSLIEKGCQ